MRAVDKGKSPYSILKQYQDAYPYLAEKLGEYCSYCEMRVTTNLAVEHKESKNSGGSLCGWDNLLLACTYCNSRKGEKVKLHQKGRWIWPDEDDTNSAFRYIQGIPSLNETELQKKGPKYYQRAENVFQDIELGKRPDPTKKDTRFINRIDAFGKAERAKERWDKMKGTPYESDELRAICDMADSTGFYSVWIEVFQSDKKVCDTLADKFPGTRK